MQKIEHLKKRYLNRKYKTFVVTYAEGHYDLGLPIIILLWQYIPPYNFYNDEVWVERERIHNEIIKYYDILCVSGEDNAKDRSDLNDYPRID